MFNTFRTQVKAHWIVYAGVLSIAFAAVGMASNLFSYWYASRHEPETTMTSPPIIMDAKMNPTNTITAGDGMIIQYHSHKASTCAAIYVMLMRGPATYQFPPLRSQSIIAKPRDIVANQFYELPHDLPAGKYHLALNVYPTCDGIEIAPYSIDEQVDVNVVEKSS